MKTQRALTVVILTLLLMLGTIAVRAEDDDDDDEYQADTVKALSQAKVSLSHALQASEGEGKPISAKFEMEDGKLQISIYTMKNGKFSEVIVDPQTGKVAKVEPITGGGDLTAAKAQGEAMSKATKSLRAAADEALKANPGYLAASVVPSVGEGHPVAEVSLAKGDATKTVQVNLQ